MTAVGYLVGAGSMSLGIKAAGIQLMEVWETKAYGKNAASWDLNQPHLKHQVAELSDHGWLPLKQPVDLIYGNPPCGGVSNMTGCHIDSETNNCMIQWCKMVVKSKPTHILMENGFQLATEGLSPLLHQLQDILAEAGYYSWALGPFYSWQVGCPQTRRRMFLCASKIKPIREFLMAVSDLPSDENAINVMDYIWDLEDVDMTKEPVITAAGKKVTMHYVDDYTWKISDFISQYPHICMEKFITPKEAEKLRKGSSRDREILRQAMEDGMFWYDCPPVFSAMQLFRRPHRTLEYGPSNTVLSDFRLVHPTKLRYMSMRECARLTGYPDWWQFHECKPHLIAQGIPAFNSKWAIERLLNTVGIGN